MDRQDDQENWYDCTDYPNQNYSHLPPAPSPLAGSGSSWLGLVSVLAPNEGITSR